MIFPFGKRLPFFVWCISLLLLFTLTGCDTNQPKQVPASWNTLLSLAQQAAKQVDDEAILEKVRARPASVGNTDGTFESLEVEFVFLRSTTTDQTPNPTWQTEMLVTLEDTSPTSTLQTLPYFGEIFAEPTTEQRDKLTEALATVQLSPAQALAVTLEEGKKYAEQHNVDVAPTLGLVLLGTTTEKLNVPAVWDVGFLGETTSLHLYVDARTGQILNRREL